MEGIWLTVNSNNNLTNNNDNSPANPNEIVREDEFAIDSQNNCYCYYYQYDYYRTVLVLYN